MTTTTTTNPPRSRRDEVPPAPAGASASLPRLNARERAWKLRTCGAPYLFLLPYFLLASVFFVYPLIRAMSLAFYQTNGPARRELVGWSIFSFVLQDPDFHKALWNTTFFAVV